MFDWIRGIVLAIRYRDTDKEAMTELLEVAMKSGRRCAYDLNHAGSCLGMAYYQAGISKDDPCNYSSGFSSRAEHYQTIFNSAQDMKNYRLGLHKDIERLERRVETLEQVIEEHNIRTGENVLPFGKDDIPF